MKQFIKLFFFLVALSLVALAPSYAQFTVDLYVNNSTTVTQTQTLPSGTTVATFTLLTDPNGITASLPTVEPTAGVVVQPPPTSGPVQVNHLLDKKGTVTRVITVDAAAVPAHLRHGDTYVTVTGPPPVTTATVTASAPDVNGYVTITVFNVDMNVKVTFNWSAGG